MFVASWTACRSRKGGRAMIGRQNAKLGSRTKLRQIGSIANRYWLVAT